MDLVATPKNPIPLGASTGFIEVRKGLRLRFASWQSALRERRGTVCIFPGRAEFIEKYFEVVGELRRRTLDILRSGYSEEAERLLGYMDEIYAVLVTMDYPDAITNGLRRQTDLAEAQRHDDDQEAQRRPPFLRHPVGPGDAPGLAEHTPHPASVHGRSTGTRRPRAARPDRRRNRVVIMGLLLRSRWTLASERQARAWQVPCPR